VIKHLHYVPTRRSSDLTDTYELYAKVHWAGIFMPFAFVYKAWSNLVEQINLPLSSKEVEMTGNVLHVDEGENGRQAVRAWIRRRSEEHTSELQSRFDLV